MRLVHVPVPAHPLARYSGFACEPACEPASCEPEPGSCCISVSRLRAHQAGIGQCQLDRHSSVRTGLRTVAAYLLARGYRVGYRHLDTGDRDTLCVDCALIDQGNLHQSSCSACTVHFPKFGKRNWRTETSRILRIGTLRHEPLAHKTRRCLAQVDRQALIPYFLIHFAAGDTGYRRSNRR